MLRQLRVFAGCAAIRDLIVCVTLILLIGGAVVPGVAQRVRETAQRVRCASNLRQIGQAILLFSNDNRGEFPRTKYDPKVAKWTAYTAWEARDPMGADGPEVNDVTAAMFMLLRTQDITSEVFVCPSSAARAWNYGGEGRAPIDVSNFPSARHLSYSYANPYPDEKAVAAGYKLSNALSPEFALAGDMNPGGEALLKLTPNSPPAQMREGRSLNHDRDGQNILYGDGHVEWVPDPFAGVLRDNVYTFGPSGTNVKNSGGTGIIGSPIGPGDSVLLPIADKTVKPDPALAAATQPRGKFGWSQEEALQQLALNPGDAYLQYVVLQLGRRGGSVDAAADEVRRVTRRDQFNRGGRDRPDLFALFTGAAAVQESLQLDAMTGAAGPGRAPARVPAGARPAEKITLASLTAPGVKSHPWKEMLGDKQPPVSALSKCVPEDFYLAEFGSMAKLVAALDSADLWSTQVFTAAMQEAVDHRVAARLLAQLALGDAKSLAGLTDALADEVAVTGSDPFLREGSDFTVLLHVRDGGGGERVAQLDQLLAAAQALRKDVRREEIDIGGVKVMHLSTADRSFSAFSARPSPDVYVRSNSRAALERVIGATKRAAGVTPLGESLEFKYIRTLMPRGAAEEDGLIYLSDPLIRNMVGPKLKLTERRRLHCYNHIRMIGHAALLHRTETGKAAGKIDELIAAECLPAKLECPDGGSYALHEDGIHGTCSIHGRSDFLTPCLELPLENISAVEAQEYRQFVEQYNQYWRRFFDPIAIRLRTNEREHRVETIILPLIDNSIYTAMAGALGGAAPQHLDALPVPSRNIFSVALRYNKEKMLAEDNAGDVIKSVAGEFFDDEVSEELIKVFLSKGIGDQLSLHIYDAKPMFGFDVTGFLGAMTGMGGFGNEMPMIGALVASLNAPVYVAVPVRDAAIVDRFLEQSDKYLAREARHSNPLFGMMTFRRDFYRLPDDPTGGTRVQSLHVGPLTFRIFWTRIGDALYLTSKGFIVEDLRAAAGAKPQAADGLDVAHAMVRVRPEHWNEVLGDYEMASAEKGRLACLDNLGPLSDAARALSASGKSPTADETMALAAMAFGVNFYCPDGGAYAPSGDGRTVACSVHGSPAAPRQAGAASARVTETMRALKRATATLTFLEDGLHAVMTVERAEKKN